MYKTRNEGARGGEEGVEVAVRFRKGRECGCGLFLNVLSARYISCYYQLPKEKPHVEYHVRSGSGRLRLASMHASPSEQQSRHSKRSVTIHLVIASLDPFADLCPRGWFLPECPRREALAPFASLILRYVWLEVELF